MISHPCACAFAAAPGPPAAPAQCPPASAPPPRPAAPASPPPGWPFCQWPSAPPLPLPSRGIPAAFPSSDFSARAPPPDARKRPIFQRFSRRTDCRPYNQFRFSSSPSAFSVPLRVPPTPYFPMRAQGKNPAFFASKKGTVLQQSILLCLFCVVSSSMMILWFSTSTVFRTGLMCHPGSAALLPALLGCRWSRCSL